MLAAAEVLLQLHHKNITNLSSVCHRAVSDASVMRGRAQAKAAKQPVTYRQLHRCIHKYFSAIKQFFVVHTDFSLSYSFCFHGRMSQNHKGSFPHFSPGSALRQARHLNPNKRLLETAAFIAVIPRYSAVLKR